MLIISLVPFDVGVLQGSTNVSLPGHCAWGEKQKLDERCNENQKKKERTTQKRTEATYGSDHRAMLPSVFAAAARWHSADNVQDESNPRKRIRGIMMAAQIPLGGWISHKGSGQVGIKRWWGGKEGDKDEEVCVRVGEEGAGR